MNEEIKEILDNFKKYEARYKLYNETQFIITHREIIILLDYITNLQKQLEAYENMRKEMLEIINYYGITEEENDDWFARYIFKEFLNILNKVGKEND